MKVVVVTRAFLVTMVVGSGFANAAGSPDVAKHRAACDRGDDVSCTSLGLLFPKGDDAEKFSALGAAMYQKTCDGGAYVLRGDHQEGLQRFSSSFSS